MSRLQNIPDPRQAREEAIPPVDPAVQDRAAANQARAAAAWTDTARDMTIGNIVRARETAREVRVQILAAVALALVLLAIGLIWTVNVTRHDRLVAQETAAGQQTPYTPETVH